VTMMGGVIGFVRREGRVLRRLAGDMGSLTAQRVFQRAVGLVSLYFVVRHLSQTDFGQYQFAAVAVAAAAFMALPGLDNAVMQSVARGSEGLYRRATRAALFGSLLGAVLLIFAAFVLRSHRPEAFLPLLAAAVLFPAYAGLTQWKSVLLARTRFSVWALTESLVSLTTHGLLISAVLLDVRPLWIFVALYFGPGAVMNVLASGLCWARMDGPGDADENDRLFRYGLGVSAVTMVSMIAEQVERIAIFLLLSPAVLAVYLAGDRLSELIRSVAQDGAAVLAPRFARMTAYEGKVEKAIWLICMAAGIGIVVFAFTLAPPLLILIFGPAYAPSIPFAQALLCSVAVGNVGQFQFRFIRSQLDGESFRTVTLWTSGLRIVAGFALVYAFGVWGAVATVFLHRLALSALSSAIVKRRYRSAASVAHG